MSPISQYADNLVQHQATYAQLNTRFNLLSTIRLIVALAFFAAIFCYLKYDLSYCLPLAVVLLIVFLILLKVHGTLSAKRNLSGALVDINKKEIAFLENGEKPFADGKEYLSTNHPYSHDLDIYGEQSIFQYLNRTSTFKGKARLAQYLDQDHSKNEILLNQAAIQELVSKLEWRQDFSAKASLTDDREKTYTAIEKWAKSDKSQVPLLVNILSFVLPIAFIALFIWYLVGDNATSSRLCVYAFLANLALVGSQYKKIIKENLSGEKSHKVIESYGQLIDCIENETFESEKLKHLRAQLVQESGLVSKEMERFGLLLGQLSNIFNPVGAFIFDGSLSYHIHVLRMLKKWKARYADKIAEWLEVVTEFEALNSLANFAYNNPDFVFPTLNESHHIRFKDVGHPLIDEKVRVGNDVSFNENPFVILTGSNMSGKSTFLRSLGVNMVLAKAGAPVCAKEADLHPLPVWVSMRLSDNLNENESYFFAEVKRLKQIMEQCNRERSFVLLDEILRGTNSNDKRNGTVQVIKKLIEKKAIGSIATHDLKVCDTTADYPDYLSNKCFEVEIVNDALDFDYKLREGICHNQSATFIMKKMKVI